MLRGMVLLVASLLLGGACGVATAKGECKEYKPLAMCSEAFQYVCETTSEGCEQCSCVPKRGTGARYDGTQPY